MTRDKVENIYPLASGTSRSKATTGSSFTAVGLALSASTVARVRSAVLVQRGQDTALSPIPLQSMQRYAESSGMINRVLHLAYRLHPLLCRR